ncbi:C-GCAxxG-C-C family protein [Chloroflexota bacterium]
MEVRIRDEYQKLSRQELLETVSGLASKFENYSMGCSQSTIAAIHKIVDVDDIVVKLATSAAGGTAIQTLGTCGALSGGIMMLDYFFGRPLEKMSCEELVPDSAQAIFDAADVAEIIANRFIEEYGTFICCHIQRRLFGRTFWNRDPQDYKKFEEAAGHSDPEKCRRVVSNAAKWTMEILLEKGT